MKKSCGEFLGWRQMFFIAAKGYNVWKKKFLFKAITFKNLGIGGYWVLWQSWPNLQFIMVFAEVGFASRQL